MKRDFRTLLELAFEGSDEAISEIVEDYGPALRIAIRKRLSANMRRHFDSEDFMQTVWKSFFAKRRRIDRFETPNKLGAFLVRVARNKVIEQYRRVEQGKRYNLQKEQVVADVGSDIQRETQGSNDTPSQYAIAKERLNSLQNGASEKESRIFELRAQGLTYKEIALEVQLHEDSVRRIIGRARKEIQDEHD